jgi:Ca-activated chloride channel family protein
MVAKKSNLYRMLGLLRSATPEEIRRAYLRAAKKLHPDKNQAAGETELFLDVQQAYQVLVDPQRRAAYDATLPPDEVEQAVEYPLDCKIEISRSSIHSGRERQLVYILATIAAAARFKENAKAPPLNICLVLDCSTSMQGPKMDMAKASAIKLLHQLGPDDIFSLVRFSDRAEVAIPASRQVDIRRSEMQIRTLDTGGGTEILSGLTIAIDEVQRYNNPKYVNHVILLTDGRTYGDEQQCYEKAKIAASEGIGISGMGLGSGWNDVFLDHLANITGASTMFIQQPQDIERFLSEKFINFSRAFAQSVDLCAELAPGVVIDYAFRLQPEVGVLSFQNTTHLGPVFYDEPLLILLELGISSDCSDIQSVDLLKGHLEATIATILAPVPDIPFRVNVRVVDDAEPVEPPTAILQALSKVTLYRMQEKARGALEAGDYQKATQHLQRLATHLLAQGEKNLAKTILLEAQHIEQQKAFTESGEKQIKYGTRSLLLMPGERTL